jgi:superfamily II DNA/RNA helicase
VDVDREGSAGQHVPEDPPSHRLRQATLTKTFRDLGVIPEIADALETEGIVTPFPIQEMALPLALSGQDIIGQARTGTGKTYAFGIPTLQLIGKPRKNRKKPRGLILAPTRELALQVTEDLVLAAGKLGTRITTVYGGRAYEPQIEALKNGVDVVVGTPGRLLDLVNQKHLDLSQIAILVLDEADRMLDLGFLPDIERIIKLLPEKRQTMLFSATMPGEIVALSRRYLNRPTHIRAEIAEIEAETKPRTTQFVYRTHRMDKIEILARVLQSTELTLAMVFCETKRACDMVANQLRDRGFAVAAVHGDLSQSQREQALRAFRNGKINVLVATDVAARGIDVDDVTHVINYDLPQDEKTYIHRIGRTGRAGRSGVAITFVEWTELARWMLINSALGLGIPDPVETYSSSPHLYSDLHIPEGAKGVPPRDQRVRAGLEAEELDDSGDTGRSRSREDREERRSSRRERRRTRGGRAQQTAEPATAPSAEAQDGAQEIKQSAAESTSGRRSRRGANRAALSDALADIPAVGAEPAPEPAESEPEGKPARRGTRRSAASEELAQTDRRAADRADTDADEGADQPVDESMTDRVTRPEPERIIPSSPFEVVFRAPVLAIDDEDDDTAPPVMPERPASRRRRSRSRRR